MVNIYCDTIDEEMLFVARTISKAQHEDVMIITPTETLEVRYEKEAEEFQQNQT